MIDGEKQQKLGCCISHEFLAAASRNPDGIAILHATGGARLFRESRGGYTPDSGIDGRDSSSEPTVRSLSPPVYDGDTCFTYSQLSLAVQSLSSRLRAVLDEGHDPHLVKPSSGERNDCTEQSRPASSLSSAPSTACLRESGDVYRPKIVGICMPPSVEYVVSVLSVLRCGEAFLPIDPWWPRDKILSVVSSSNVDFILRSYISIDEIHNNFSDWITTSISCPMLSFSMDECLRMARDPCDTFLHCEYGKQRLFCYVMYTSGSTGNPKGVCGTEQGLLNRFLWMQELYPFRVGESVLFKTSLSFIDHLQEFLGTLLSASTLVVPPFYVLKENLFAVLHFLEAYRISRLTAVPSLMRALLPALQSQKHLQVTKSLKLLVLSGEEFSVLLWKMLSNIFPHTSILNLYGSTEVSGDCTYFDCERLPILLETEALTSVPIGRPISNCKVVLVGEDNTSDEGEILVSGLCISCGCLLDSMIVHSDFTELFDCSSSHCFEDKLARQLFYRTGDFARRLENGDLIFLGRKDRILKINGQRVSLGEIENALRGHEDVIDAAVLSEKGAQELISIKAFILLKEKKIPKDVLKCIRRWLICKLPAVMIPHHFFIIESFPMTYSGKVDYEYLAGLETDLTSEDSRQTEAIDLLQVIKKTFLDALMVEVVSDEDDFFAIGGNSISAAHVSYNLGINMRLLYDFPSPYKLCNAMLEKVGWQSENLMKNVALKMNLELGKRKFYESVDSETAKMVGLKANEWLLETSVKNGNHGTTSKRLKAGGSGYSTSTSTSLRVPDLWASLSRLMPCSLTRCNRVMYGGHNGSTGGYQSAEIPRDTKTCVHKLWKFHMGSCVDSSPLLVVWNQEIFVLVGAHSQKFACIRAKSGSVQWEIKLDGRIEGSAAITDDFAQVVVGCYKGKIYFLELSSGKICWTFETAGEVKSQPLVDKKRQLVWCGSYDHILYALDYKNLRCVYKVSCGGSVFGSPALDELHNRIYVASTNGCITALSIETELETESLPFDDNCWQRSLILQDSPFYVLWKFDLELPVFASLSMCPNSANVICCLVDGSVIAFDSSGSITWKVSTDGPIFAGACISSLLPSQVLICSRNGKVYSFNTESGKPMWEHDVGEPITASAYVDENLQLMSDRLVCVCTCSGSVVVLRVNLDTKGNTAEKKEHMIEEFARLRLEGDIFSSPVMIGGLIFVGCRDDYFHCLAVEATLRDTNRSSCTNISACYR